MSEATAPAAAPQWKIQERYGWGWSVYSPDGMPGAIPPVSTARAAEEYCKARNEGKTHDEAWEIAMQHGETR